MAPTSTDEILTQLNPFGRVQMLFLGCMMYTMLFMPMLDQSVIFMGATPSHHCSIRDGYYINESIPLEENGDGEVVYSECKEYIDPDNASASGTQDCQNGWDYSDEVYGETIITEWDLVCQPNPAAEASQSILQFGGMLGALLFGPLADGYGRRPTLISTLILYDITMLVMCFSPSFYVFLGLRLIAGFSQMGTWVTISCIVSEYMIPKYRNISVNIPQIGISFSLMLLALLAFLIRDWRYLQLAIHAPIIAGSFVVIFLPESLRWVIGRNKAKEAGVLIRKLAKINRVDVPSCIYTELDEEKGSVGSVNVSVGSDSALHYEHPMTNGSIQRSPDIDSSPQIEKSSESSETSEDVGLDVNGCHEATESVSSGEKTDEEEKYDQKNGIVNSKSLTDGEESFGDPIEEVSKSGSKDMKSDGRGTYLDLFKPPVLHVTVVIGICRFTFSLVYFGFALNTGQLAGDPYLNFFLSALVEIPAKVLSPFLYARYRRTYIMAVSYGGCCAALISMAFIPNETKSGTDLGTVIVVMSLLGKFFVTMAFGGMLLLVMELFPTSLRIMGNGLTLCMGRTGGMLAPFILYADAFFPSFSSILMAVMSFLTATTILTLPDTRTTAQPQTADDLRDMFRTKKGKKTTGVEKSTPFRYLCAPRR